MTRSPSLSDNAGFTLMEVLVAIAIFSIGLMAVGYLQANSLKKTGTIARNTEAWIIADSHASWLKSLRFYTNVPAQIFDANLVAGAHNQPAPPPNDNRYTVHWQVTDGNTYDNGAVPVFSGVGGGVYVVSKDILVLVTELGGNPANANEVLARLEFTKTWAATRIP